MLSVRHYSSPLGGILIAADETGLTGLWFDGQKYFPDTFAEPAQEKETPVLRSAVLWLDGYFRGDRPDFTPPLHPSGTPFRRAVWDILLQIPYGETATYGEIARRLARERRLPGMSAQAVGGAVGHNPISLIIPCHRVVGADGSLTGYAGGLERKAYLLALEQGAPSEALKH